MPRGVYPHRIKPLRQRFDAKWMPEPNSGCWLWISSVTRLHHADYGIIGTIGKKTGLAHRVAWTLYHGEIPQGLCVCHRCDTPLCVNPDHLFLGTKADNSADMARKGRSTRHPNLTISDALEIRSSKTSRNELARRFGTSPQTISNIRNHKTWKHIKK